MVPTEQDAYTGPCLREAVAMMKMCPLCHSEMPERYNYCYQCGEYVGDTAALKPALVSRSRSAATAAGTGHPLWVLDAHCPLDGFWPVVFLQYESLATRPVYS